MVVPPYCDIGEFVLGILSVHQPVIVPHVEHLIIMNGVSDWTVEIRRDDRKSPGSVDAQKSLILDQIKIASNRVPTDLSGEQVKAIVCLSSSGHAGIQTCWILIVLGIQIGDHQGNGLF